MPMPNARDTINEIESTYRFYKSINMIYFVPLVFVCSALCAIIYRINQTNIYDDYKTEFITCIGFLIFIVTILGKLPKITREKSRKDIFDIAIDYYKAVYSYMEDAKIEKISYFDVINISSVYERCKELEILSIAQLDNLLYLISNLKYKYYLLKKE